MDSHKNNSPDPKRKRAKPKRVDELAAHCRHEFICLRRQQQSNPTDKIVAGLLYSVPYLAMDCRGNTRSIRSQSKTVEL